jgi:lipocalin
MDGQLKGQEIQARAQADGQKAIQDAQLKQFEIEKQMELERYKADLEAQTAKEIAVINAQVELEKEQVRAQYTVDAARAQKPAVVNGDYQDEESKAEDRKMEVEGSARMENLVSQIGMLVQTLAESVNRPKTIVRGPDGRAVGVQ